MIKNGGYTMLDLATASYKDAQAAFNANKPILVYDGTQVYYADTCVYDSDNDAYVLTKGGKTITIDSSNNVVSSGDVANTLMENIKDSSGNLRFIEGDGLVSEITGFTSSYCKWSLSGTHLMIVLAGEFDNNTTIEDATLATFNLPQWILDKIFPVYDNNVEVKSYTLYASDWSSQSSVILEKKTTNALLLNSSRNSFTLTNDRTFRIQFDLMIDND